MDPPSAGVDGVENGSSPLPHTFQINHEQPYRKVSSGALSQQRQSVRARDKFLFWSESSARHDDRGLFSVVQ